jgi:hypothetical protein
LESLEIFIRFSKNSLLLCCVAKCENGNEIAEETQTRALSDQPHCLFAPSYTECIAQRGNKFECSRVDGTEDKIIKHKTQIQKHRHVDILCNHILLIYDSEHLRQTQMTNRERKSFVVYQNDREN